MTELIAGLVLAITVMFTAVIVVLSVWFELLLFILPIVAIAFVIFFALKIIFD